MDDPRDADLADAATALRARQRDLAARYAVTGGDDGGQVVVRGGGAEFTTWLFAHSRTWRSLHSIRLPGRHEDPDFIVPSLRNNLKIVRAGLEMVSVFSIAGFPRDMVDLLAQQPVPYRVAQAPMDLKVVDRSQVLLEGPRDGTERTLMLLRDPTTMKLAHRYWQTVARRSRSAADAAAGRPSPLPALSPRQRAVAALLTRDTSDERAAEVLGVSVRTLRSDVADLKRQLGVDTRFAAGVEIGRLRAAG